MITVIGAGPSGNYFSYLLSKKGYAVQVFEENKKIGLPVQCTGLISDEIKSIMRLHEDCIMNKIEGTRIISPSGVTAEIKLKENLVIDRALIDLELSERAAEAGAEFYLATRLKKIKSAGKGYLLSMSENGKNRVFRADYVIGADGPNSTVAHESGLFGKRKFFTGTQIVCPYRNDNAIDFYLMKNSFAWIVPINEKEARIGIASEKDSEKKFREFLRKILKDKYSRIIKSKCERNAGAIPIFNPLQRIEKDNVFLLGDAATQVKATTLGGIVPGLKSAEVLAHSISKKTSYTLEYMAKIFPDLYASLMVRRIIGRCSDDEIDKLVSLMNNSRLKNTMRSTSRDRMMALGMKALLSEPKLFYFLKKI
jgi:digeranylgeranylglycerophospholipid reductase